MGKRGRDSDGMGLASMVARRTTKSAIADVLTALHEKGMLSRPVTRQDICREVAAHASVTTPYGTVVQKLTAGLDINVECCPPAAMLHYLCTISDSFAECCKHAVDSAPCDPMTGLPTPNTQRTQYLTHPKFQKLTKTQKCSRNGSPWLENQQKYMHFQ